MMPGPARNPLHRALFVLALAGAGAALVVDSSDPGDGDFRISAVTVARWLRDGRPGLTLADLRPVAPFREYHLPQARRIGADSVIGLAAGADSGAVIVVYGSGDGQARTVARQARQAGMARVLYLRAGVDEWHDEVLTPVLHHGASARDVAAFERVAELSRYFGGRPRRLRSPEDTSATASRRSRRGCGI
jgi:rhodanese-related sulfurtransferase